MPNGELHTVAEKQLILSHIKRAFLFKKIPKVLELVVSLSHFVNDILKNIYFSCHILLHAQFHCLVALTSWYIEQHLHFTCLLKLTLIKTIYRHDQKVQTKIYISWEQKELLRWNEKHFSSFVKDFRWIKYLGKKNSF